MKAGRRVADPAKKALMGTYRKDRHADIVTLAEPPRDVPVAPPYLTIEAKLIWDEEFARVVACGAVEADSTIFGRYCEMEAVFRRMILTGETKFATLATELRRSAELLGIAGQRSRLARMTKTDTAAAPAFTTRPH